LLHYVRATPKTYHGTKTLTNTRHSEVPVDGTATDTKGNTYEVSGTADVTTNTRQEVPYDVDYEELYAQVLQKQPIGGIWKPLTDFDRRTLCPALFGICVGNRHPYQKILEDSIKWVVKNQPQQFVDFQPEHVSH
jgi:hypothetical protein